MAVLLAVSTFLFLGCGVLGGEGAEASQPQEGGAQIPTPLPTNVPPPAPIPTPTLMPAPTPTPAAQSPDEALNLLWVYLSRCISIDASQLEAYMVKGDWFVRAVADSPREYGFWKVEAVTGAVEPHDNLAREWHSFVDSQCDPEFLAAVATPTPTTLPSTPAPPPPPPPPPPVVTEACHAVTTLWAHLVPCYPGLPTEVFEAMWSPAESIWIVRTKADTETDYGVWTVGPDGSIASQNSESRLREAEVLSGTC